MATPAQYPFDGDGSRRVFPIPSKILGTSYIRIHIDGEPFLDTTLFDIINNSIVFKTAPASGTAINVWVAETVEDIANLGSVTNVDAVGNNIDNINLVAEHIDQINGVASDVQLEVWNAEAWQKTADSYATEAEDVFVKTYTSDGDGTFTPTDTTDYSAYHWSQKASTFNPALYATLSGATFTGQVKGITPVSAEDLTRKDYVDTKAPSSDFETGTWTPTITNGANASSSVAYESTYTKVGNHIICVVAISVTPTVTATPTVVNISLPISTDITVTSQSYGAVSGNLNDGLLVGDTVTDDIQISFTSTSTLSSDIVCSFTYRLV